MKKRLFGILTFLGIGFSFCNGLSLDTIGGTTYNLSSYSNLTVDGSYNCVILYNCSWQLVLRKGNDSYAFNSANPGKIYCGFSQGMYFMNTSSSSCRVYGFNLDLGGSCPEPEDKTINVFYNNGNSTSNITCDGVQAIAIEGLSTITNTNTFTPYFNINYRDQDNQLLTESYSKDILYLSGGKYKKTYTGNNDRILTNLDVKSESIFTGYKTYFDVTGSTQPEDTEYNMFNNFADNSLKVLLSNIPGYIQYGFIFMFILLLLSLLKMFKRRK